MEKRTKESPAKPKKEPASSGKNRQKQNQSPISPPRQQGENANLTSSIDKDLLVQARPGVKGDSQSPLKKSSGGELIAYVHNLSPVKRNKKNTMDYTSLTLQVDENRTTSALCYSKIKRKILEEKEHTRCPIKIARYTKTADGEKIVINEKTVIATPSELEYSFQFNDDEKQLVTIADLKESSLEDGIAVWVKVVKIFPTKTITSSSNRRNKVAELVIMDNTDTIQLDLWNEQIDQVNVNKVYRISNLCTNYWNQKKKLTGTLQTIIKEYSHPDLNSLEFNDDGTWNQAGDETTILHVQQFTTVEEVNKYKTCLNCNKRIMQFQTTIVKCDHCNHIMRASACPTRIYANVVVRVDDDQNKTLTLFDDCLASNILGPFDAENIDANSIIERLLFLQNITLSYNTRNVVSSITIQ